jgi:hypothetical protein
MKSRNFLASGDSIDCPARIVPGRVSAHRSHP